MEGILDLRLHFTLEGYLVLSLRPRIITEQLRAILIAWFSAAWSLFIWPGVKKVGMY